MQTNHDTFSTRPEIDPQFELEMTRAALRALGELISDRMTNSDSMAHIAMGVGILMDQQCDQLAKIEEALRDDAERDGKERLPETANQTHRQFDSADAAQIAHTLKLKPETVQRVIHELQAGGGHTAPSDTNKRNVA